MSGAYAASRREFLLGLAGALIGWAAGIEIGTPEDARTRRLAEALGGEAAAREIGRAYLEAVPGEASRPRLRRMLEMELDAGPAPEAAELRVRLAARCRSDFAEGRAVNVDGWRLAQSEARACALVALS